MTCDYAASRVERGLNPITPCAGHALVHSDGSRWCDNHRPMSVEQILDGIMRELAVPPAHVTSQRMEG